MSKKKICLAEIEFTVKFTTPPNVSNKHLEELLLNLDTKDAEILVALVTQATRKVYYA